MHPALFYPLPAIPPIKQQPAHLADGQLGSLLALEVHKAVALGHAVGIRGHLAGQDAAEGAEGVVQRLVVNGLVQVLFSIGRGQACSVSIPPDL